MIKKTKNAVSDVSEIIKKDLEYNSKNDSSIKLTLIEISRGLMNLINKGDGFMSEVYSSLSLPYGKGFRWRTQDNEDMGCFIFIYYKCT
jgi:hypothetical protein